MSAATAVRQGATAVRGIGLHRVALLVGTCESVAVVGSRPVQLPGSVRPIRPGDLVPLILLVVLPALLLPFGRDAERLAVRRASTMRGAVVALLVASVGLHAWLLGAAHATSGSPQAIAAAESVALATFGRSIARVVWVPAVVGLGWTIAHGVPWLLTVRRPGAGLTAAVAAGAAGAIVRFSTIDPKP